MSKHRFHGDAARFEIIAEFITNTYGKNIKYLADVAGGQGMLARQLNKRGYKAAVIDPRGWTLVGVPSRQVEYTADLADYYDLIVGLHPDEALRNVVASALVRPIVVVPCCNFWDRNRKLGRDALLVEIENYFKDNDVRFKKVTFDFDGPQNIGFVTDV